MEFEVGRIITYNHGKRNAIVTYSCDEAKCLLALCDDCETHLFTYSEVRKTDVINSAMDNIMFNLKYCRYGG
jgi:hypothetical protein